MAGVAWKLMAFMFLINIAGGIFNYVGTQAGWNSVMTAENNMTSFGAIEKKITGAPVENSLNFGEKILDFITLGFYSLVRVFLNNTIFGFPTLLFNTGLLTDGTLLLAVKSILSFIYVFGMVGLFSRTELEGR